MTRRTLKTAQVPTAKSKQREVNRLVKKLGIVGWHGLKEGSVEDHLRDLRLIERELDQGAKRSKKLLRGARVAK